MKYLHILLNYIKDYLSGSKWSRQSQKGAGDDYPIIPKTWN